MTTRMEAHGSSYIADVLKRGKAEGRQGIRQGFSNACCAPILGEEGKVGQYHSTRQHWRAHTKAEFPQALYAPSWQTRDFSSLNHHLEA